MIPARILSAWFGPAPEPAPFVAEREKWRAILPGWEFLHVTSTAGLPLTDALAADGYPPVVLADVARLELLHREGGIWLDLDVTLFKSLDPLRSRPFVTFEHPLTGHARRERSWRIASAVVGMTAGEPLLAELAEQAAARARAMPDQPVQACGPDLWTMFGRDFERAGVDFQPYWAFHPASAAPDDPQATDYPLSYGVHRCAGSWR